MKSLKHKIIITALMTAFSGAALADCTNFERAIVITHDRPALEPRSFFDGPNHEAMQATLNYTPQQVASLDVASIAYFKDQMGLDFGAPTVPSVPVAPGVLAKVIPVGGGLTAFMVPYINGHRADIPIIYDSESGTNKSFSVEVGNIVVFLGSPTGASTLPGGILMGKPIKYFDNFFYGYIDLAKQSSDGQLVKYESLLSINDQMGNAPLDMFNRQQLITTLKITDQYGKVGYGMSLAITDQTSPPSDLSGATVKLRNVYTWPCS